MAADRSRLAAAMTRTSTGMARLQVGEAFCRELLIRFCAMVQQNITKTDPARECVDEAVQLRVRK